MKILGLVLVVFLVSCIPLENDATRMVPKQGDERIVIADSELSNGSEVVVKQPVQVAASGLFHEITIDDLKFFPNELKVGLGDEVTWLNEDSVDHSIVMGEIESPVLKPGGSFTFTFLKRGTFAYSCGIHPSMTGSVVVS
jgi:plastocyanin|tara:strand:+ start:850 stop:1269 length:420 start_codon:yes stop_codon:yes gene_type:complete